MKPAGYSRGEDTPQHCWADSRHGDGSRVRLMSRKNIGLLPAGKYREFAERCTRQASATINPVERTAFKQLAEQWRKLEAKAVEREGQLDSPEGHSDQQPTKRTHGLP